MACLEKQETKTTNVMNVCRHKNHTSILIKETIEPLTLTCCECRKSFQKDNFWSVKYKKIVNRCQSCREKDCKRRQKLRDNAKQELGILEYRKREAEKMRKWNQNNKEHLKEWKKNSLTVHLVAIKGQAKKKNIEWDNATLPIELTKKMMMSTCEYCGIEPINCVHGIDRINNDCHYTLSNCVTACKACNCIKKCLDPTTFIERCEHISRIHGGKGTLHKDAWPNLSTSCTFSEYERRAFSKDMTFELTMDDFNKIVDQSICYYCHNPSEGVDRKNNDLGYSPDNCVNCCKECNQMKAQTNAIDFIENCQRVAAFDHRTKDFSTFPRQYFTIKKRTIL